MFLILLFGLIGALIRGFSGFLVGALLGFVLSQLFRALVVRGLRAIQDQFVQSTFAVVGAISKADGVVTRDEIEFAESLFDRFRLSPAQRDAAKAAFARGKASDFDLEGEVDRFRQSVRSNGAVIHLFLQVQLRAVAADGEVHPSEHDMLIRIARRLGLSERDIAGLEALLRATARGGAVPDGPPPREQVDDAYAVLGVSPEASDEEIKKTYRKLMAENHPDRLASKGLPDSMKQLAEERAAQINAAYDLIKKARG